MINFPTKQELEELRTFHEPFCLSIYVPFIEPNASENPSRIVVKNLLREAETTLVSSGVPVRDVRKTLQPIKEQMEQSELWPTRDESLVFFSHPHFFRHYHMPNHETPYLLTVETGFNLDALLQVMQSNKRYFVLALGHKNVRLYEGDRDRIHEVKLKNFPHDMLKSLRIDEFPKSRETHSIAPASSGKGSEAFHEQYNVRQVDKVMLKEFFRRIDKWLSPYLQKRSYYLILAGVEYELAMYRSVSTYPNTLADAVIGNLDDTPLQSIREKAWAIVSKELK